MSWAAADAIVLMPTGGGKSLCYQLPALLRPGLGVVVSPLIALMKDQVDALRQAGVRAAALNSGLAPGEAVAVERAARDGSIDLLYVSPERLMMPHCLEMLQRCRIALFAIDEAHCISQWGHDFRRDYQALGVLKQSFPAVPLMALTATADGPTRRDIAERLHLEEARVFAAGYDRPNLFYRVVPKHNARDDLLRFLERGASGRRRDRLLPDPARGRGHRYLAEPTRPRGAALPCRPLGRDANAASGSLSA